MDCQTEAFCVPTKDAQFFLTGQIDRPATSKHCVLIIPGGWFMDRGGFMGGCDDARCLMYREIAERLLAAVAGLALEHAASPTSARVSVSVGIATWDPSASGNFRKALAGTTSTTALIDAADRGLYEAKHQGRMRACWAPAGDALEPTGDA